MKSDWKEKTLGSLVKFSSGGTPNKKNPNYWNGTIPWISAKNMKSEVIETSDLTITEEGLIHGSKLAPKDSVLLLVRGSGLFNGIPVCYVKNSVAYNQDVKCIESISELENKYLFYWFKASSDYLQKKLEFTGIGAGKIDTRLLSNLVIRFPDKVTRKKIIDLADNISDRISINKKINENLEQQLATLFAHTFAEDIAVASTETCPMLGDLITVIDNRGKTPPLTTETRDYPIIDVGALKGTGRIVDFNNCTKYVEQSTYETWFRSGHPKPWDILISTVGSLAEMKIYLGSKGCMAQNVVALRATSINPLYLYQYLRYIRADLVAYNIGSVQPSIKVTHIVKHPIFVPERSKLENFEQAAEAATNQLYANYNENESLKELRDTLLPRLMSGELDVSELDL